MTGPPNVIGLLMINGEDDVLERSLDHNAQYVDAFYVLDGTVPNTVSEQMCRAHPKCWGYRVDADVPSTQFGEKPVCGWRDFIHGMAVHDHGPDNWFVLLHGDELWTQNPRSLTRMSTCDGFIASLPFYFPRDGEPWDDTVHPLDQLRWHLWPGYPEFRMFKGAAHVRYDPHQRFDCAPRGLTNVAFASVRINHYPYRAPDHQRARAAQHAITGFDPDNYKHIADGDRVYWTDEMIAEYQTKPWFNELRSDRDA